MKITTEIYTTIRRECNKYYQCTWERQVYGTQESVIMISMKRVKESDIKWY